MNAKARTNSRIKKEDAGVSINADKPYNLFQRLYLMALGTLTARQLI